MSTKLFAVLTFLSVFKNYENSKILGVFPIPSISHQVVYQPIWKELSLRGHKVTVLTPNPLNDASLKNLTEIDMSSTYSTFRKDYIGDGMSKDNYVYEQALWLFDKIEEITIEHLKKAEHVLKNPETEFDLIIVETLHPLVYSLGCRFKVPIVGISSLGLMLQTHDAVGNPTHPVLTPEIFANIMGKITFYEKICSVLHNLWYRIVYYWYVLPRNDNIAKKFWGSCPYLGDLEKNVSLILVNTNPVLHPIRPNLPNIIEMGQMHFSTKKELPSDLQKYLDGSTRGAVYFSLGTNAKSTSLSPKVIEAITDALSELNYNVLWKWEDDVLPNKPKNVLIRKWFPQQDILGHKNLKVFITQGGLQSMEEAISNCVPMVAMPFIADQPLNAMKMVSLGLGRSINYVTLSKEEFKEMIVDVAENEEYKKKVCKLKDLFSDQPMRGLEKSVWWIEYVLRHDGARHLRSPAADMSWVEYFLLDVIVFLVVVLFIFIYFVHLGVKIFRKFFRGCQKIKLH